MRSLVRIGMKVHGVSIKGLERHYIKYCCPKIKKWFYVFYHEKSNFVRTGMELPTVNEVGFKVYKVSWDWNSRSFYADKVVMEYSMDKLEEFWVL